MPEDQQRMFSVEEANALLPTVEPLLTSLREAQQVMEERHDEVMNSAPTNGGGAAHQAYRDAAVAADAALRALADLGIVVRDPGTGLIDFPAEREGEHIFLCWRLGEDAVAWWHPQDTGFAGRRPL